MSRADHLAGERDEARRKYSELKDAVESLLGELHWANLDRDMEKARDNVCDILQEHSLAVAS